MHIIHCLPFPFPDISVHSLISQRHLVSCCMIACFVSKKIRCADRSWKFIFWSWKSHGKSLLKKSGHPVLYCCLWTVPSTVLDAVQEGAEGPMWHPIDHPFDCQITSPKKETKYHGMKSFIAYQITPSVSISLDYLTNWSWSLINHFMHLFIKTDKCFVAFMQDNCVSWHSQLKRILLKQSFTGHVHLLMAISAFTFGRRCSTSPDWCHLCHPRTISFVHMFYRKTLLSIKMVEYECLAQQRCREVC